MAGIGSRNTRPELTLRSALHRLGFRFRLHPPQLPGKPDIVLPRYRVAVFVNGCFWHGHGCNIFRWPSTNTEAWKRKIDANIERDAKVRLLLREQEWRVITVWECAMKGKNRLPTSDLEQMLVNGIRSDMAEVDIRGR